MWSQLTGESRPCRLLWAPNPANRTERNDCVTAGNQTDINHAQEVLGVRQDVATLFTNMCEDTTVVSVFWSTNLEKMYIHCAHQLLNTGIHGHSSRGTTSVPNPTCVGTRSERAFGILQDTIGMYLDIQSRFIDSYL